MAKGGVFIGASFFTLFFILGLVSLVLHFHHFTRALRARL
jgi:hypothetical protein